MSPCSQNPPDGDEVTGDASIVTVEEADQDVAQIVPPTTHFQGESVETYTPYTVITYAPTPQNIVAYTSESVATHPPGNVVYAPEAVFMYAPNHDGEY